MTERVSEAEVEALAHRDYPVVIRSVPKELGGGWRAEIPDLPGCIAHSDSVGGALALLEDAKRSWIEAALEEGRSVPEPSAQNWQYSGRVLVRMPRSLHRALAEMAEAEGTSLNQVIVYLLSRSVGAKSGERGFRHGRHAAEESSGAFPPYDRFVWDLLKQTLASRSWQAQPLEALSPIPGRVAYYMAQRMPKE